MSEIVFNINNNVKVKLTNKGKEHLLKRNKDFFKETGIDIKFELPKEDSEGYSEYQLWDLIGKFGDCLQACTFDVPFETNIKFQVPQPQPTITVEGIEKRIEKLMALTCRMNTKPNNINDRIDEVHDGLREILNIIKGEV